VANVAADCPKFKQLLIQNGVVKPLADRIMRSDDIKIHKQTIWSLANVCRGKNTNGNMMANAAPAFIKMLLMHDDYEILSDALMGLADICSEH